MDARIEAFLTDVLALEGQDSDKVRESVRVHLSNYERQFRDAAATAMMPVMMMPVMIVRGLRSPTDRH
jgi:hypothetical protein